MITKRKVKKVLTKEQLQAIQEKKERDYMIKRFLKVSKQFKIYKAEK